MYTPPMFKPDRAACLKFAEERGFGTFCAWDGRKPIASLLPFYLAYAEDGTPRACFHVARHNQLAGLRIKACLGSWLSTVPMPMSPLIGMCRRIRCPPGSIRRCT